MFHRVDEVIDRCTKDRYSKRVTEVDPRSAEVLITKVHTRVVVGRHENI